MAAWKRNEQLLDPVLKNEPEITVATAREKLVPQFPDTKAAANMRLSERFDEIAKSQ